MNIIAAVSLNGVIGNKGQIPWNISEDLKFFKRMTEHSMVVMGRHTWNSLPKKPLPNRINFILSSTPGWSAGGIMVNDLIKLKKKISAARILGIKKLTKSDIKNGYEASYFGWPGSKIDLRVDRQKTLWVIGGESVYKEAFACSEIGDKLYLTIINGTYEGDRYFPFFENGEFKLQGWEMKQTIEHEEYKHVIYERIL